MEWQELKDQIKEMKKLKFKIYNGQTGKYVCNRYDQIRIFDTKEEAVAYIRYNNLSNVYEIRTV